MVGGVLLVVTHSGMKRMVTKMLGNNRQGRIVQGQNIHGRIVPVPLEGGTGSKQCEI
jgi:hypothetical protein